MSTEATAVTTVDSATTPEVKEFNSWDADGTPIRVEPPSKSDSATDKEKTAVADSAPQDKEKKSAVTASDSATDKDTQPHRKTKEDTERRIQELLDRVKKSEERAEAAERKLQPEKREQASQPAPVREEYKPLDDKKFFTDNPKASYEDFIRAAAKHEAKWEAGQEVQKAIVAERQRIAMEAEAQKMTTAMDAAVERYGKEEAGKIIPALDVIVGDPKIPMAVKAMLNDSDVVVDLLYVLRSDEKAWGEFLTQAKSNPGLAIRKLVTTEALVREQLKTNSGKKAAPERGDDGKFQKTDADAEKTPEAAAEPKPRAPKPPTEVGGRAAGTGDELVSAAKANDFRSFEAEEWRRKRASQR